MATVEGPKSQPVINPLSYQQIGVHASGPAPAAAAVVQSIKSLTGAPPSPGTADGVVSVCGWVNEARRRFQQDQKA